MFKSENSLEKVLTLQVRPEREHLIGFCYEAMGYRLERITRNEHADTMLEFVLEDSASAESETYERCRAILKKIEEIDKQVSYYFLKLDCLVGLIGAVCLGLSVVSLRAGMHVLFTIPLFIGLFGCTITLYLRPVFTRMGMKKYGGEEPALIAELYALLDLKKGGDEV